MDPPRRDRNRGRSHRARRLRAGPSAAPAAAVGRPGGCRQCAGPHVGTCVGRPGSGAGSGCSRRPVGRSEATMAPDVRDGRSDRCGGDGRTLVVAAASGTRVGDNGRRRFGRYRRGRRRCGVVSPRAGKNGGSEAIPHEVNERAAVSSVRSAAAGDRSLRVPAKRQTVRGHIGIRHRDGGRAGPRGADAVGGATPHQADPGGRLIGQR